MKSEVAVVEIKGDVQESFDQALQLVGGIDDLNTAQRTVVIKVGIFDPKGMNYPKVNTVYAIVNSLSRASQIYIAESDNYRGTGSERLQIWKSLFTERVVPFNLSDDTETVEVEVAGEKMGLSHILFKPNVFISTHSLRRFEKGTILKNLLGLIPERKKARFHKKLVPVLLDLYEAVGGIDLAVIDASYTYSGPTARQGTKTDVLVVGRNAVAVETVGATLVGLDPKKMPVIQEAAKRGLGEGDIDNIQVLGSSVESLKERFKF